MICHRLLPAAARVPLQQPDLRPGGRQQESRGGLTGCWQWRHPLETSVWGGRRATYLKQKEFIIFLQLRKLLSFKCHSSLLPGSFTHSRFLSGSSNVLHFYTPRERILTESASGNFNLIWFSRFSHWQQEFQILVWGGYLNCFALSLVIKEPTQKD